MWEGKKVSVVFPAYNEEPNIENAVKDFLSTNIPDEIVVVDNNSRDATAKLARKAGARVVTEKKQGYGHALQRGLREAKGHYIITAEPDGTFRGVDIKKLLLYADDFDAVFGTRTSKECIWSGANMNWFLRIGNWFVAKLLEYLFNGPSFTDVGCTMKLIKKKELKKIINKFKVGGSHFSPEFMIRCLQADIDTVEIPIIYKARKGESKITGNFWPAFKLGTVMIFFIIAARLRLK